MRRLRLRALLQPCLLAALAGLLTGCAAVPEQVTDQLGNRFPEAESVEPPPEMVGDWSSRDTELATTRRLLRIGNYGGGVLCGFDRKTRRYVTHDVRVQREEAGYGLLVDDGTRYTLQLVERGQLALEGYGRTALFGPGLLPRDCDPAPPPRPPEARVAPKPTTPPPPETMGATPPGVAVREPAQPRIMEPPPLPSEDAAP